MGIDLSAVDWTFVGLMTALSFITALLGSLIAFRNRVAGAIIAAILFGIGFVAWNYYPHTFGLPILRATQMDGGSATARTPAAPAPAAAAAPTAPATPAAPSNPVTTIAPQPSPAAPPAGGTMAPPPAGGTMAPNTAH
jgi:hypothetical protein